MNIVDAYGKTEIHLVVEVAADIKVVFAYVATHSLVEGVARSIIIAEVAISILYQTLVIDVVQLIVSNHGTILARQTVVVKLIEQSFTKLLISELILRSVCQATAGREYLVEIAALMIVEAEVKERLSASTCRINEAYLVEAHVSLVAWRKTFHLFLRNQTKGACYLRLAEQTNTCRVGADSGNICSKSIHSSTHTHIACSTVKLVFYEIGILVSFLCKGRRSCESHSCHKQYLCFHIIFFFFISSKKCFTYLLPPK